MKAITHDNGQIKVPARKNRTPWWVPAGLILLSAIPLTFGVIRLIQLMSGAEITPANARFFASPSPVVFHIISSAIYALLGAFQFVSRLWQRGRSNGTAGLGDSYFHSDCWLDFQECG